MIASSHVEPTTNARAKDCRSPRRGCAISWAGRRFWFNRNRFSGSFWPFIGRSRVQRPLWVVVMSGHSTSVHGDGYCGQPVWLNPQRVALDAAFKRCGEASDLGMACKLSLLSRNRRYDLLSSHLERYAGPTCKGAVFVRPRQSLRASSLARRTRLWRQNGNYLQSWSGIPQMAHVNIRVSIIPFSKGAISGSPSQLNIAVWLSFGFAET